MKFWFYYIVKFVTWIFMKVYYRMEVYGTENLPKQGSFVIASNHSSHLDPVVIGVSCPRPVTFMARDTLFKHWLMGRFLKGVRTMPLKRDASDIAAMRYAIELLKAGDTVCIFPEGTRSLDGNLGQAKRGIDLLAKKSGVPVVPVYIQGTFQALPKGAKRLQRAKIRVAYGRQISYTGLTSASKATQNTTAGPETSNPQERQAPKTQPAQLAVAVTEQWHELKNSIVNH